MASLAVAALLASTILIRMPDGAVRISDTARADRAFLPASTFKIPNSLISLETGAIKDENEVLKWDGKDRGVEGWNADQDMRTAIRRSTVWFYQELARRIGRERMQAWLERLDYGNREAGPVVDTFWLDGDLRITPRQQLAFIEKLRKGELPFSRRTVKIVEEILIVDRGPGWVLRAKTGWAGRVEPSIGWYVGWLERADGRTWTFVVNLDIEDPERDLPKREALAREALKKAGALP